MLCKNVKLLKKVSSPTMQPMGPNVVCFLLIFCLSVLLSVVFILFAQLICSYQTTHWYNLQSLCIFMPKYLHSTEYLDSTATSTGTTNSIECLTKASLGWTGLQLNKHDSAISCVNARLKLTIRTVLYKRVILKYT